MNEPIPRDAKNNLIVSTLLATATIVFVFSGAISLAWHFYEVTENKGVGRAVVGTVNFLHGACSIGLIAYCGYRAKQLCREEGRGE